jgi:hypothetical protein
MFLLLVHKGFHRSISTDEIGEQAYGKNLRIQMGRCPVRSIFPQALEKLRQKQDLLGYVIYYGMFEKWVLDENAN